MVYIQSTTTVRDFFGLFAQEREGAGSGSIIDEQGDILTNYHVIADAEKLTVSFGSGKEYPARVVGKDPDTDLAVIQIIADAEGAFDGGTVWRLRQTDCRTKGFGDRKSVRTRSDANDRRHQRS